MSHGQREERVLDLAVALRQAVLAQRQCKTTLDLFQGRLSAPHSEHVRPALEAEVSVAKQALAKTTATARAILDDIVASAEWIDRTHKTHAQVNVSSDPTMKAQQIEAHPSVMSVKFWDGRANGKGQRYYIQIKGEGRGEFQTMDLYMDATTGDIVMWNKDGWSTKRSTATTQALDAFRDTFPFQVKNPGVI